MPVGILPNGSKKKPLEAVLNPAIAFKIVAKKRSNYRNMPDISRIDRFTSTKKLDTRGGGKSLLRKT
jgi:hypothetical protein